MHIDEIREMVSLTVKQEIEQHLSGNLAPTDFRKNQQFDEKDNLENLRHVTDDEIDRMTPPVISDLLHEYGIGTQRTEKMARLSLKIKARQIVVELGQRRFSEQLNFMVDENYTNGHEANIGIPFSYAEKELKAVTAVLSEINTLCRERFIYNLEGADMTTLANASVPLSRLSFGEKDRDFFEAMIRDGDDVDRKSSESVDKFDALFTTRWSEKTRRLAYINYLYPGKLTQAQKAIIIGGNPHQSTVSRISSLIDESLVKDYWLFMNRENIAEASISNPPQQWSKLDHHYFETELILRLWDSEFALHIHFENGHSLVSESEAFELEANETPPQMLDREHVVVFYYAPHDDVGFFQFDLYSAMTGRNYKSLDTLVADVTQHRHIEGW